jgi:hypothetical protein
LRELTTPDLHRIVGGAGTSGDRCDPYDPCI